MINVTAVKCPARSESQSNVVPVVVRRAIDSFIRAEPPSAREVRDRAIRAAGRFASATDDTSSHHDAALADGLSVPMIFVDTFALYAVLDRDDRNHPFARSTWGMLLQEDAALIVTNYVVVETTALVQHRLGMEAVRLLCGDILPALDVHWIGEDEPAPPERAARR